MDFAEVPIWYVSPTGIGMCSIFVMPQHSPAGKDWPATWVIISFPPGHRCTSERVLQFALMAIDISSVGSPFTGAANAKPDNTGVVTTTTTSAVAAIKHFVVLVFASQSSTR